MSTIISVRNVSKIFNLESGYFSSRNKSIYAVNDISFDIERGQIYGLVGESGCGKTTTARLIMAMYKINNGGIYYFDKENNEHNIAKYSHQELKLFREKTKYIFQDPARSLNPRLNVFGVMTAGYRWSKKWPGKTKAIQEAENILELVGLEKKDLYRMPNEFSGGQRQRISIARALIMNPELLICDEIVSALDVSIQGQILNLLQELRSKLNLSMLFIAHDLKVSGYFCDKIGVMYRGVLVEEANAENLYSVALHPYTKLLFAGSESISSQQSNEVKTMLTKEDGCPYAHRCSLADNKCRTQCPSLQDIGDGHKIRCFKI